MVIHVNFQQSKNGLDYEPIPELMAVYREIEDRQINPAEIKAKVKEKGKVVATYSLLDLIEEFEEDYAYYKEAGETLFNLMVRPSSLETKEEFIAAFEEFVLVAVKRGWL